MRLWHQSLISRLPRQQLLGQHREIAALRGNGWGETPRHGQLCFSIFTVQALPIPSACNERNATAGLSS